MVSDQRLRSAQSCSLVVLIAINLNSVHVLRQVLNLSIPDENQRNIHLPNLWEERRDGGNGEKETDRCIRLRLDRRSRP
jgi:hypothetical protein